MGIMAAAEAAASKSSSSSSVTFLLLIVLVFVGFYFLMVRPQRRRQQQAAQQQNTLATGARVRTIGGMYAEVVAVDGDDVVLEVAPGVEVRYAKRAVAEVLTPGEHVAEEPTDSEGEFSEYGEDETASAEDDLADSHDEEVSDVEDRAGSNGTKAKSDSDVF
ncbi:MAG: preprotein translocase subunit YajC [Streptosporangiaceae bacterium]|nr:preprotein translocase subunit YajC [Streptosporangiaceae bacterium]